MSISKWEAYKEKHFVLNEDGEVCYKMISHMNGGQEYIVPICYDQLEDMFEYQQEKMDKSKELVKRLYEHLHEVLIPVAEQVNAAETDDEDAVKTGNHLNQIGRLIKVLLKD